MKATSFPHEILPSTEPIGEVLMIAIPIPTYKAVSDIAAKRGMSFAEFLGKAIDAYIKKEESAPQPRPRLLTEG